MTANAQAAPIFDFRKERYTFDASKYSFNPVKEVGVNKYPIGDLKYLGGAAPRLAMPVFTAAFRPGEFKPTEIACVTYSNDWDRSHAYCKDAACDICKRHSLDDFLESYRAWAFKTVMEGTYLTAAQKKYEQNPIFTPPKAGTKYTTNALHLELIVDRPSMTNAFRANRVFNLAQPIGDPNTTKVYKPVAVLGNGQRYKIRDLFLSLDGIGVTNLNKTLKLRLKVSGNVNVFPGPTNDNATEASAEELAAYREAAVEECAVVEDCAPAEKKYKFDANDA